MLINSDLPITSHLFRHEESGASSLTGLEPETAAMPLNQFKTEIESQPRSHDLRGTRILSTRESPEQTHLLLGRNAAAPVMDRKEREALLTLFTDGSPDWSSPRAVLDGFAQQVREYLLDTHMIDLHHRDESVMSREMICRCVVSCR